MSKNQKPKIKRTYDTEKFVRMYRRDGVHVLYIQPNAFRLIRNFRAKSVRFYVGAEDTGDGEVDNENGKMCDDEVTRRDLGMIREWLWGARRRYGRLFFPNILFSRLSEQTPRQLSHF